MTNKFKHNDPALQLSLTEYDADNAHIFESQEIGDIPYASGATEISGLPHGTVGQPLVSGGHGAAPSWGYMPNRNAIINGAMDIWQRGTAAIVSPANGVSIYISDRFFYDKFGEQTHTISQDTDVPTVAQAGVQFNYSIKVDCTATCDGSATDYTILGQNIEGFNYKSLHAQIVTLSFWVKAVKTGVYSVCFRNSNASRTRIEEFTINSASTWEKKTITLALDNTGTWLFTTGIGLLIIWAIDSGYIKATGVWGAGFALAGNNQVVGSDNTNNNFWLTGVQLELGSVATPFEFRPYGQELALARRYCRVQEFYIPAVAIPQSQLIAMRAVPTITGGGTGYSSTGTTAETIVHGQTTGAVATLTLAAEL